jgi:MFS family permease
MCLAHLSPRVTRRFGKKAMAAGYITIALAFVMAILVLHFAGAGGSPYDLMPAVGLIGVGQSFVNAPLFSTVLAETPRGQEGSASGILTTMQQSGSALGVATLGLIFFSALGPNANITGKIPAIAATSAFERTFFANLGLTLVMLCMVRLLPSLEQIYGSRRGSEAPVDLSEISEEAAVLAIAPEGLA